MKHYKVLVKWNWWLNFICLHISLNFNIYFLLFPREIGVISDNYIFSFKKIVRQVSD